MLSRKYNFSLYSFIVKPTQGFFIAHPDSDISPVIIIILLLQTDN